MCANPCLHRCIYDIRLMLDSFFAKHGESSEWSKETAQEVGQALLKDGTPETHFREEFTDEMMDRVNEIHDSNPNPSP